jgi:phospholipid/cholesterol/gamma-HCH transport system ATP-binding protein
VWQDHAAAIDGRTVASSSGEVWVNGQNLPALSRSDLFDARKHMGVLFQSGALFTDLDVFENVAFPLRVHTDLPEEMIRDIVLLKLQAVGLRGAIELMPDELSGGMKRRVSRWRGPLRSIRRSSCTTSRSSGRTRSPWACWSV